MKTTKVHNTNSQYHGCWFPGNVKNQDINNNVIDLVYPEYSDLGSKRINLKNAPLLLIENVVGEWCNSPSHKLGCHHQTVRIAHHIETTIVELCPCLGLIYQLFYPHAYWGVKCPANVRIMSTGFLLTQQIKAFNYSAHHNMLQMKAWHVHREVATYSVSHKLNTTTSVCFVRLFFVFVFCLFVCLFSKPVMATFFMISVNHPIFQKRSDYIHQPFKCWSEYKTDLNEVVPLPVGAHFSNII